MAENSSQPAASKSTVFLRRAGSTLSLWVLVAGVFLSRSGPAYLGLIALLALIGVAEYFKMLHKAGIVGFRNWILATSFVYCAGFFAFQGNPPAVFDMGALFVVTAGTFILQLRHPIQGNTTVTSIATSVLGFVYIPFLLHFLARVVFLPAPDAGTLPNGSVSDQGAFLLLWIVAVTKFTDMGAYLTGTLIGRHKMIPHVSPGKTWEGFAGALLFSQLAACGLFALVPGPLAIFGNYGHVCTLALLLALLAVVGDLAESVIKRALDAKDSGRMLPGIGGSLDLIDSICFTAPAAWLYLQWLQSNPA